LAAAERVPAAAFLLGLEGLRPTAARACGERSQAQRHGPQSNALRDSTHKRHIHPLLIVLNAPRRRPSAAPSITTPAEAPNRNRVTSRPQQADESASPATLTG